MIPLCGFHSGNAPTHKNTAFFAVNPTIPGEDVRGFIELHSAFIDEWKPCGPTEEGAVLSLADLMWRNRRAQRLLRGKLALRIYLPSSSSTRTAGAPGVQLRKQHRRNG
jgi:hypothetical protein